MAARLLITDAAFCPDDAATAFRQNLDDGVGGIVTFTGVTRGGDAESHALELQHFPGYTEKEILRFANRVAARWPLADWRIIHRVGKMSAKEPIVFVATAAVHRRDAFEAADCLMDFLKTKAPFWKKEHSDGDAQWIEPRGQDHKDAGRWDGLIEEMTSCTE